MTGHFSLVFVALLAALAVQPAVAQQKPNAPAPKAEPKGGMSVEAALSVARRTAQLKRPSRTVEDIARILDQYKADPKTIQALRERADARQPAGLQGFALAEFLHARGLAARDLGRTQQRLTDLRDAYALLKPLAMKRSPIWVADFPTPANPDGSPAFQAYVQAKRDAKRAAIGGGMRGGPGNGPQLRNIDLLPKTVEESKERLAERVTPEQGQAVRILQSYLAALIDMGQYKLARSVYDEVRPSVLTTMTAAVFVTDQRMVEGRIATGDMEGARRVIAGMQQIATMTRQFGFLSPNFNLQAGGIDAARGDIALASGQPGEAEARYRLAMRLVTAAIKDSDQWPVKRNPGGLESDIAGLRLKLGQALLRQKRLVEAELETRGALIDFIRLQGVNGPKTARTVLMLAAILQAQGRFKDAQRLSEIALDTYVRGGVEPTLHADAHQGIAVALASQGRWPEAMAAYEKLRVAVGSAETQRRQFLDLNMDFGIALLRAGRFGQAVTVLDAVTKKRIAEGSDEYAVVEARSLLGVAMARAGRMEEGLALLREAAPAMLAGRDGEDGEEGAWADMQRRRVMVDLYFEVLTQLRGAEMERRLGLDAAAIAFELADFANGQSVHSAIAASSARSVADPALAELIRQTQDTDQQMVALKDMFRSALDAPPAEQTAKSVDALRASILSLQKARRTLRAEIERRFPAYAELVHPRPMSLAKARASLKPDEALVVTYFASGRGYVWAITSAGEAAFAPMTLPEAQLSSLADTVLAATTSGATSLSQWPAFPVDAAHALFEAVLQPVSAGWKDKSSLVVVASGALSRIPFGLLVTGTDRQPEERADAPLFGGYRDVSFLIRGAAVSHAPSVSAFASLRRQPDRTKTRKPFLGFGDPWFSAEQARVASGSAAIRVASADVATRSARATDGVPVTEIALLPRLPDTALEVQEAAQALGAEPGDVLTGVRASEKAVRTMKLDDRKVIMFATHGLVAGELEGLLQPALALSSPEVPGAEGDGLLTLDDVLGLKLDADWVVLSACNTASSDGGSVEAVSGLGRAFFYAGARALLVTYWPVETRSARLLTTEIFRRQAASPGLSRAQALREAALALMETTRPASGEGGRPVAYAHPLFWAAFALVGDGG